MKKYIFLTETVFVILLMSACSPLYQRISENNHNNVTPVTSEKILKQNNNLKADLDDNKKSCREGEPDILTRSNLKDNESDIYTDTPHFGEIISESAILKGEKIPENNASVKNDKCKVIADDDENAVDAPGCRETIDSALELCQASQEYWQKGELENALEALDEAYQLILKVDTYDNPKLTQQKDDLRFMISKRILEIYASRNIVVEGNHNAIPLNINEHVQSEINRFTKGREKSFFIESYKRSGLYRPMIVEALRKAGLPMELSWLPLIESGFKVNALSKARALGLWQFIPSTGYKFGLKRDRYIDERLDFQKSTLSAIEYLKELHQIFGDWTTVLAGYNCGEGRVLRVIRSQNVNYLDNFWDLYEKLPRETARYVPRFLATLHIVKNLEKYGMDTIEPSAPLEFETVNISRKLHLGAISNSTGISKKILKLLNPELRYSILPAEDYPLRVPMGKAKHVLANLENIPEYSPPQPSYVYHRVRRGESISIIAGKYGSNSRAIARANHLNRRYLIRTGQTLKIPVRSSSSFASKRSYKIKQGKTIIHSVKAGDSLWVLARKYGTTVKSIKALNRLTTTNLYIGQKLKISGPQMNGSYKVKRGDSPFSIAKRHNMSLKKFMRINHLNRYSKIYPGEKYYVE